ncbi:MAG: ADP-ribosylglycohydrolase family protein [Ardenticatenales bacterium]|nr:ADP-ribosylglycohydrolase family protein [Ardenticatenales bacterium]
MIHQEERLERANVSLEGLSVGDAFGETFFTHPDVVEGLIAERALGRLPWRFTDDTMMAMSVLSILRQHGHIQQDALARSFAERYDLERGYGPAMHRLLREIREGTEWQELSSALFEGQGSYGNGSAMRVAPLGAFFADDLKRVGTEAELSSVVTHTHPEAIAGTIAVAIAAAYAWQLRGQPMHPTRSEFLDLVLPWLPESEVRSKIRKARDMQDNASVAFAVSVLGNGLGVSAQDTVPFALWCAGSHLANYEEALWLTVSALGDRDTTCAIVGGIVACSTGVDAIPPEWVHSREPLPTWSFEEIAL